MVNRKDFSPKTKKKQNTIDCLKQIDFIVWHAAYVEVKWMTYLSVSSLVMIMFLL